MCVVVYVYFRSDNSGFRGIVLATPGCLGAPAPPSYPPRHIHAYPTTVIALQCHLDVLGRPPNDTAAYLL